MFTSFTIKNFRCFRELTVQPLRRINLIAGKNNTGKTALLEAMHLHCHPSNCQLPFEINEARDFEEPNASISELCQWLFHNNNPAVGIEFSTQDTAGAGHTVRLDFFDAEVSREKVPEAEQKLQTFGGDIASSNSPRIILRYQGPETAEAVSVGVQWKFGFARTGGRVAWEVPSVFLSSGTLPTESDIQRFSQLEAANRQQELIENLTILEPRLKRLSLILFGNKPMIHGDIGLNRLVPVALMGEGMRRLLSILLAITNSPGGVILIDEIENGLHHSVLVKVWHAIAEAARKSNVQVFATTHSYECIQAAHQAFAEDATSLGVFRLDRVAEGVRAAVYDPESLATSIEMSLEVR